MASTSVLSSSTSALKRKSSTNDLFYSKRLCFVLEENDGSSSGGAESIYSYQNYETASARDTSDTSETSEFEVKSPSENTISELSSGPENCVIGDFETLVEEFGSELSYIADLSDTFSSDDDKIGRVAIQRCHKCNAECERPFSLCLKCFRQRRVYLPPRPKGRRKKNASAIKRADSDLGPQGSLGSQGSQGSLGSQGSQGSLGTGADIKLNEEQGSRTSLCKCCFAGPVDGAFIHKNSVHTLYCYKCSVKTWRLRGRCPFCNQVLSKVAKIFSVDD